jgi:hypothetical protein
MAEQSELVREFMDARARYRELYLKLLDLKVPGVIDPADLVAAACNAGDKCHGGTDAMKLERVGQPSDRR